MNSLSLFTLLVLGLMFTCDVTKGDQDVEDLFNPDDSTEVIIQKLQILQGLAEMLEENGELDSNHIDKRWLGGLDKVLDNAKENVRTWAYLTYVFLHHSKNKVQSIANKAGNKKSSMGSRQS